MVNNCFACGASLSYGDQNALSYYYRLYKEFGQERYFYRLKTNGPTRVVQREQFNYIFESQIKPNLENGAEYAHISEYKNS